MPSRQWQRDQKQRKKIRRRQTKETLALIARQAMERTRRILDISDEEWAEAELEDAASADTET